MIEKILLGVLGWIVFSAVFVFLYIWLSVHLALSNDEEWQEKRPEDFDILAEEEKWRTR